MTLRLRHFLFVACLSILPTSQSFAIEAEGTNAPQSVAPTGQTCDADAFYNSLGQSESGGCGGGNQYNCTGPVITSGMHKGDKPLGKYQFMPKTLAELGIPVSGFVGNAAAQEEAIRRFTKRNNHCLDKPYTKNGVTYPPASDAIGTVIGGVKITRSGLLGASHLSGCGGARRVVRTKSTGSSDQLGTSALAYAGKFEGYGIFGDVAGGTCGEGVPNAALLFAQAQVDGIHDLIGCDPTIFEAAQARVEALQQLEFDTANQLITQPTPVEQATCLDQHTAVIAAAGGIHSNPGGTIQNSIGPVVQQPLAQTLGQFGSGIQGTISNIIESEFSSLANSFFGDLGSLFGGGGGINVPKTDCDMQQMVWDVAQCIEMPQLPSLSNIIGGKLGELAGNIANAPDNFFDAACNGMNDVLGGAFRNASDVYENAANATII